MTSIFDKYYSKHSDKNNSNNDKIDHVKELNKFTDELNRLLTSKNFLELLKQQYLTTSQVANILKVKESLLNNWRTQGKGPKYIKLGADSNKSRGFVRYPMLGKNGLIYYLEKKIKKTQDKIF